MTDVTLSYQVFRWVKYATYALLSLNIWFFLAEEIASARFAIETGEDVAMGIQLFSATLDTLAWVILLLLFELETAVIPDDRLRGGLRYGIHGVRMLCTLAIVMAFLGYLGEWQTLLPSEPLIGEACSRVNEGWSVMVKLDDFVLLTAENCAQFGSDTRRVAGLEQVLASPAGLLESQRLALAGVVASGCWSYPGSEEGMSGRNVPGAGSVSSACARSVPLARARVCARVCRWSVCHYYCYQC